MEGIKQISDNAYLVTDKSILNKKNKQETLNVGQITANDQAIHVGPTLRQQETASGILIVNV